MELMDIVKKFDIKGTNVTKFSSYGNGHVNGSYILILDNQYKYLFQRINHHIFSDVDGLMNNIILVTDYLKRLYVSRNKDPERLTLTTIYTKEGHKPYFYDDEKDIYYRIYPFIDNTIAYEAVENKGQFKLLGETFANFANLLSDFDASKLVEVIPDFHNTKVRYNHLMNTIKIDRYNRVKKAKKEIEFVKKHEGITAHIVHLIEKGEIPLRVTHNDTKLNNVLFDKDSKEPLCVIDLDTIMPGSVLYDFGDSVRFGCNPAGEDEMDLNKVIFNEEYFKAFAEGYIRTFGANLTRVEKENLLYGCIIMTLECGIRFLDDYLDGEKYFKVNYEGNNLIRARTQFHLVEQMEENYDHLQQIILSIK